jgi:formylglycine-generating enzyme required for sulfatase activity
MRRLPEEDATGTFTPTAVHKEGGLSSSMTAPGGAPPFVPGYEIIAELGRGGMGVVYRARQVNLNREVALKMVLAGGHAAAAERARFLTEAEAIAAIPHPGIVQVFDFGTHDGLPFFSLEFCEGGSLAARLAENLLPPREAVYLVEQVAQAVQAAHERRIIHRDLKPANILLARRPTGASSDGPNPAVGLCRQFQPKVTDFGLAKRIEGSGGVTATGALMGTPSYMAPEQARGSKDVGVAADVYALGAILYDALTGRPPFKAANAYDTVMQVCQDEPVPPRELNGKVPADVETICLKCLQKDPARRYATAGALAAELGRWLAGEPIAARPAGGLERAVKWARRRPTLAVLVGGSGLAALLLGVLSVVALWQWRVAETALSGEREARVRHDQERTRRALAQVDALLSADPRAVPTILINLAEQLDDVLPRLRSVWDEPDTPINRLRRSRVALALLPVEPGLVRDYLYARLLDADPHEVPVIRDALAAHKDELLENLWAVALKPEKGKEPDRLRAAAALAKYDPQNEKWARCGPLVANNLVLENPLYFGLWSEAFRPVRDALLGPLAAIFRARFSESERILATNLLADYAADRPQVLAELLMEADDRQFAVIYPKLKEHAERGLPLLTAAIDAKLPADLPSWAREGPAKRQATAAVALLRMNQPAKVWPLLKPSPDPRLRSYLIHRLSPLGADAGAIVKQLDIESDLTIRRALVLILGQYGETGVTPEARNALLPKLKEMYRTESDPGLHAACEWLLRHNNQKAWLTQVNEEWARASRERQRPEFPATDKAPVADAPGSPKVPQWYVNTQGQTMVVIPGPVEFLMGSPPTEVGRAGNETQHKRRIGRTFALSAKSVTVAEYRKFEPHYGFGEIERWAHHADSPVIATNWFQAVQYCNGLSKQEGLPESDWCYEPFHDPKEWPLLAASSVGLLHAPGGQGAFLALGGVYPGRTDGAYAPGMRLARNYLQRHGYRLPTEAEMEYAIRAGTVTARHYGETEELLPNYAWYYKNAQERAWPVASLMPNELGIFDAHGNAYTWCQERFEPYPPAGKGDEAVEDQEDALVVTK